MKKNLINSTVNSFVLLILLYYPTQIYAQTSSVILQNPTFNNINCNQYSCGTSLNCAYPWVGLSQQLSLSLYNTNLQNCYLVDPNCGSPNVGDIDNVFTLSKGRFYQELNEIVYPNQKFLVELNFRALCAGKYLHVWACSDINNLTYQNTAKIFFGNDESIFLPSNSSGDFINKSITGSVLFNPIINNDKEYVPKYKYILFKLSSTPYSSFFEDVSLLKRKIIYPVPTESVQFRKISMSKCTYNCDKELDPGFGTWAYAIGAAYYRMDCNEEITTIDWDDSNLQEVNHTKGSVYLSHNYSAAGNFNVKITTVNVEGCIMQESFTKSMPHYGYMLRGPNSNTSNKNNNPNQINVYPNPATSELYIESNKSIDMLSVVNSLGMTVLYIKKVDLLNKKLNIENLNIGTYFLTISFEDGNSEIKKIVKLKN
jgi:hypothetical protein